MFERLLLVWLLLLSGAAYAWPSAWVDPFLTTKPLLQYFFAATMFAIGSMLPRNEVNQALRSWPRVLGGTAVQYTVMPLLGYCMALLFGLQGGALIGTIMVGCVPGAMASNVLTQVARGNVSYSVSITTSSTILSPLVVPWALYFTLGRWVEFPVGDVTWNLCWTVVLPVVAGNVLGRLWPRWETSARRWAPYVANLTILWIIATVVALNRDRLTQGTNPRMLMALLSLNVLGYTGGWLGAWAMGLPSPMRRALTLEVGMQNAGLGTLLAMNFFHDAPEATIPTAVYTFGCMLTGTLLARFWAEYTGYRQRKAETGNRNAE